MKIAVLTIGCRTNQAESAHLEEALGKLGHEITNLPVGADIVIINSCSVTASADRQSRQLISRALKAGAKVIVTGCYADLNREKLINQFDGIQVVTNNLKDNIIDLIPGQRQNNPESETNIRRHRPIIKVQDGCNNSCSYCVIPLARGRARSILPESVLEEALKYESLGFHEIVLSGIHLGQYGQDLNPVINLDNLLRLLIRETGISRIRLSSIELSEVTDEILDIMKGGRICHHLHIPLQGGTDKILKSMNRHYTIDEYKSCVEHIVASCGNVGIGADVMTGFPGEGDKDFESALLNIAALPLSYLHVFPFSARPGTEAIEMPDQVPVQVKKQRTAMMLELGESKRARFILQNLGCEHDIVVESSVNGGIIGTTSNYIRVVVDSGNDIMPGSLIKIRIVGHCGNKAVGIPLYST
jgi:threonylcarbamoyladenosine tRNA methylthiotransferase MtaB